MKCIIKLPLLVFCLLLLTNCTEDNKTTEEATVTDADGNVYNTLKIGNQTWMVENLKTTKYNDGTPIPEYANENNWCNLNTQLDYYQWADTSDLGNMFEEELPFDYYGAMYNHFAIESGKLAPKGWRIPSEQDFIVLENYLSRIGHNGFEALILKSTSGWSASSGNGTDLFGFKALPAGYVHSQGGATGAPVICSFATTNINLTNGTRRVVAFYDTPTFSYGDNIIQIGSSVRCIKE